jgi:hypothetical protein
LTTKYFSTISVWFLLLSTTFFFSLTQQQNTITSTPVMMNEPPNDSSYKDDVSAYSNETKDSDFSTIDDDDSKGGDCKMPSSKASKAVLATIVVTCNTERRR